MDLANLIVNRKKPIEIQYYISSSTKNDHIIGKTNKSNQINKLDLQFRLE